jgi:indole-3-glycerol phosphate synthase
MKETILDQIVATKKREIEILKDHKSYQDFEKSIYFEKKCLSVKANLLEKEFGIIAEFKRKSPSAGKIVVENSIAYYLENYQRFGAAAISILTDNNYFGGSCEDIFLNREQVKIPILRKEFIVDEIQIVESKAIGADAILLISEILTKEQIKSFTTLANSLGLEVILELNKSSMFEKIYEEVDVLGINNRDLAEQKTDIQTSFDLFSFLPASSIKISESGIRSDEEINALKNIGFHGVLIGESILKKNDFSSFFSNNKISSHVA